MNAKTEKGACIRFEGLRPGGEGVWEGAIEPGEHVALLGGGGEGALRAVLGMVTPAQGDVRVDEIPVRRLGYRELRELRSRSAYVFPRGALSVNLSIGENVALPLRYHSRLVRREIDRRVAEMLERLGIEAARNDPPARCDEQTLQLAGFARAFVTHPALLLLEAVGQDLSELAKDRVRDLLSERRVTTGVTILQWNVNGRFDVVPPDRMLSSA